MKEMILKFNKTTGEVAIEAMGFKGQSCAKATEFLKESLGQMKDFQKKAEWFEESLELNDGLNINSNYCG